MVFVSGRTVKLLIRDTSVLFGVSSHVYNYISVMMKSIAKQITGKFSLPIYYFKDNIFNHLQ